MSSIAVAPENRIIFDPTLIRWQVPFLNDKSPVILLEGEAGSAKSRGALEKAHAFMSYYPNAFGLLVRKTRESMINSTVLFYERQVVGNDVEVVHREQKKRFDYSNGSILAYGGMKDESQREAIRSIGTDGALDFVFMEEALKFVQDDYGEMLGRMRGKAAPWTQVVLGTNPGSPYHWIYKDLMIGGKAKIYHCLTADNPFNPPAYKDNLARIGGVLGRRLREGKWLQAEGVVYEEYSESLHLIDPFPIPKEWRRFRVIDFGYEHPFVCFDDKTEVMTRHGWSSFADLAKGEPVATVNQQTKAVEWQVPTAYIANQYDGPMVTAEPNEQGANFSVTPNHRMVVANRKSGNWRLEPASRLGELGDSAIPTGWNPVNHLDGKQSIDRGTAGGRGNGRGSFLHATRENFARFLGLFLSEGCLYEQRVKKTGAIRHLVKIAQKTYPSLAREWLRNIGCSWHERTDDHGVITFSIQNAALYKMLEEMCGKVRSKDKRVPSLVWDWGADSLAALMQGLMMGDGRHTTRDDQGRVIATATYFTTSRLLADDVQQLACILGIPSRIRSEHQVTPFDPKGSMIYRVALNVAKQAKIDKLGVHETQYSGTVRCVTVPNGILVVRRDGRPMVCGNCQWWAVDGDGRMYRYREIYMTHRTVEVHAEQIKKLSLGERIEATICDHDAEDRATLDSHGIKNRPATKAVSPGIQEVIQRLKVAGDGKSRLFLMKGALVEEDPVLAEMHMPTCTEEEITLYSWLKGAQGQPKDTPRKEYDHGMDTTRYMAMELKARVVKPGVRALYEW